MCCAGAVHTDAGCVVNMCCCFSAGAVHTDAACVVDVCCCFSAGAVHTDAACVVDVCCCFCPCLAVHICNRKKEFLNFQSVN